MDYTLSTFLPECSLSNEPKGRGEIEKKIGLEEGESSMPVLMHLLLSFMKGVRTTHGADEKPAPSPAKINEETNDFPMPNNLIPSDPKKEDEIKTDVLGVEDEVKTTPVNPVLEK